MLIWIAFIGLSVAVGICLDIMNRRLNNLSTRTYHATSTSESNWTRIDSVRDATYLIDKKIAKLEHPDNSDYHTKLFKALGGTIMRSDPDAEGFGHIEFRLSDRSTCNMYDKVDDAGVERQCKSMLDNLLPGVARGLDLMDHRLKLIEESKETKTKK